MLILIYSTKMAPFKFSFFLFLSLIITTSCTKEEEPDVPCLGSFSCNINGKPFETSGDFGCTSKKYTFSTDSNTVTVMGRNCNVSKNEFSIVVFDIYHVVTTGTYPIGQVNCGYRDDQGRSKPHNMEVEGSVNVSKFVPDNYGNDYTGGYIEGTFWFTAYNEDTKDTAQVTNGQFCGRI